MQLIAQFDSPEEAHLFKMFLGSRGIESTVLDENMAQMFWYYRSATGGVRVVLNDVADLSDAREARHEYFQSLNVSPPLVTEVKWWPVVLLLSWAIGGPLLIFGRTAVSKRK